MPNYSETTYEDAKRYLTGAVEEGTAENQRAYEGDHWQEGTWWVGPRLEADHPLFPKTWNRIQTSFTSQNVIREVANRERNSAASNMDASLVLRRPLEDDEEPSEAEQALLDEAWALFMNWQERGDFYDAIMEACVHSSYGSRGVLRFFLGLDDFDGEGEEGKEVILPQMSEEEAAELVFLHAPDILRSAVHRDPDNMKEIGIFSSGGREEETNVVTTATVEEEVELTYLEGDETVIRIMTRGEVEGEVLATMDLGRRLTMHELRRDSLITEQIRSMQKQLNMTLTMQGRNTVVGGFLERIFMNAQMPYEEIEDEDSPDGVRYEPRPLTTGPGATTFLAGVVTTDDAGNERIANPSISYRDPVEPTTFIESDDDLYARILHECSQQFVLMSADATASGASRIQARAEFEKALEQVAAKTADAYQWMIETFLAITSYMAGTPGKYEELRASVTPIVNVGPLSAEEQAAVVADRDAGLISTSTAMRRLGVRDVEGEQEQVAEEQRRNAELLLLRAQTFAVLSSVAGAYEAAISAGYDEEEAQTLAAQRPTQQTEFDEENPPIEQ